MLNGGFNRSNVGVSGGGGPAACFSKYLVSLAVIINWLVCFNTVVLLIQIGANVYVAMVIMHLSICVFVVEPYYFFLIRWDGGLSPYDWSTLLFGVVCNLYMFWTVLVATVMVVVA